jgi:sortase A
MSGVSSSLSESEPATSGSTQIDNGDRSGDNGRRPRGRRRVSPFTLVGVVLLVAGLSCLGWVAYQYFGTNVVSQKTFQSERQDLRTKWADQGKTKPQDKLTESMVPGDAVALLRIPAFGAHYEVPILNGTQLDVLSKGVGHYNHTAQPGQIGNFALAGHRVTHGQPFSRLLELNEGDEVVVETGQAVYTYVLDQSPRQLTVKDTDTWVLDPVPGKPAAKPSQALITLTTCQDLFHSPDRSIAFGHLESTKNKS